MTAEPSFDHFAAGFAQQFEVTRSLVRPGSLLADDLLFDSFATLLLIMWIEESSGLLAPCFEFPELTTVQDAYDYLCTLSREAHAERIELRGA